MFIESINPMSFDSGPGIRVEVILSKESGILLTVNELVNRIRKFRPYFGVDGGGVTFKGDVFLDYDYLYNICRLCNKSGINVCIETNGLLYNSDLDIFKYLDLVILSIESLPLLNYNNNSVDELMNVDKFITDCEFNDVNIFIKQEIFKNINDTRLYIELLKKYLSKFNNIIDINLYTKDNIDINDLKIYLCEV